MEGRKKQKMVDGAGRVCKVIVQLFHSEDESWLDRTRSGTESPLPDIWLGSCKSSDMEP